MANETVHKTNISTKKLLNKIILITGAGRGIGSTMAKAYAKEGATVILLGRNIKNLTAVYDHIIQQGHPIPAIYPLNLATAAPKDYEELAKRLQDNFNHLDGLLLNAAQLGTLTPIEYYDISKWYEVMQVNLHSAFLLSQVTIPLLKLSSAASIVFTTTDITQKAKAYFGAYAVSKFGLEALMHILSEELTGTSNIRINSVKLDKIRSGIRHQAYPFEDQAALIPPEDLVPLYVSLMADL